MSNDQLPLTPFLRWAGGKRWILPHLEEVFPCSFETYYEPFLGGGAVFFYLQPEHSVISDANAELVNTYKAIRNNWKRVVWYLKSHQANHSDSYYYEVRAQTPSGRYQRAARFIYLNRTCYNGLYRVNLRGEFNVPRGSKNQVLFPDDNFEAIAAALSDAKILHADFESLIEKAGKGDLVYLDPPYTINHANNSFIKYNDVLFSWEDQVRLRDAATNAVARGAIVLISNAFHESIVDLYSGHFQLNEINRYSAISGQSKGRQLGKELLIVGTKN